MESTKHLSGFLGLDKHDAMSVTGQKVGIRLETSHHPFAISQPSALSPINPLAYQPNCCKRARLRLSPYKDYGDYRDILFARKLP
jgi:hypothetical protein